MSQIDDYSYFFDPDSNDIVEITEQKKAELIGAVEELGMLEAAASEVGLTVTMIQEAATRDPRLVVDLELAKGRYKASILRRLSHLAFNGFEKAIVGGRNRDEILGTDVIPSDKALELLARMQFADELAIVTRQKIKAEMTAKALKSDQIQPDVSKLSRSERKILDGLMDRMLKVVGPQKDLDDEDDSDDDS